MLEHAETIVTQPMKACGPCMQPTSFAAFSSRDSCSKHIATMGSFPTAKAMGWEPEEGAFKDCVTLPEVGTFLGGTARELVPIVKEALQLWLQASKMMPQRLEASLVEVKAVQAALQAAPAPTGSALQRVLIWMHRDLARAFSAMLDHLKDQVEAFSKLAKVLKTTGSAEQYTSSWVAAVTSHETCWLQDALIAMIHLVGAALTLASPPAWGANKQLAAGQMGKRAGAELFAQLSHEYVLYQELWETVLSDWATATGKVKSCVPQGVHSSKPSVKSQGAHDISIAMSNVYMKACTVWLKAAARAPPNRAHDGTVMLNAIHWSHLPSLLVGHPIELQAEFREAMLRALGRPDFWDWFMTNTSVRGFCIFLCTLKFGPQHLPHMPYPAVAFIVDQAKVVMELKERVDSARRDSSAESSAGIERSTQEGVHNSRFAVVLPSLMLTMRLKPQHLVFTPLPAAALIIVLSKAVQSSSQLGKSSASKVVSAKGRSEVTCSSMAGSRAGAVGGDVGWGEGLSTEGRAVGSSADDSTDMFDMHALLQMMYGESGVPANVQAR